VLDNSGINVGIYTYSLQKKFLGVCDSINKSSLSHSEVWTIHTSPAISISTCCKPNYSAHPDCVRIFRREADVRRLRNSSKSRFADSDPSVPTAMAKPDIADNTTHDAGGPGGRDAAADSYQNMERMRQEAQKQINDMITGAAVPIIVGIYGISMILPAAVANDQSQMANQLALLSLCYVNSVRCLDCSVKTYITDIRT
jgi:hypothetical protein